MAKVKDFLIRYRCPNCNNTWEEVWSSACDSECPNCDTGDIQALMYIEVGDEWTEAEDKEWMGQ
jgi:Zn finger protein HypA/HybF involved in hydrogenase expression